MKKAFTIFSCLAISAAAIAQNVPNAGFESWVNNTESNQTLSVPQSWISLDVFQTYWANASGDPTFSLQTVRQIGAAHSGASAVEMYVDTSSQGTIYGGVIYSVSTLAEMQPVIAGTGIAGYPMSARPASLDGYYKASYSNLESPLGALLLTKWNTATNQRDTLCFLNPFLVGPSTSSWTAFSIPITYATNQYPDTILIGFALASNNNTYDVNSTFALDDLALTGNVPIGMEEQSVGIPTAHLFPNPVASTATLSIPGKTLQNAALEVYDIAGQLVARMENQSGETIRFNREGLKAGMYFYSIIEEGEVLARGSLIAE
jgi:hypothetical protein